MTRRKPRKAAPEARRMPTADEARARVLAAGGVVPTPERWARGLWIVGTGERVFTDSAASPLRRALRRGVLTLRQVEAGEHVEAVYATLRGSQGRSCLDWEPRGGSEASPERIVRLRQRLAAIEAAAGPHWRIVRAVACYGEPTGQSKPPRRRFIALFRGLWAIADLIEGKRTANVVEARAATNGRASGRPRVGRSPVPK